MIIAINKKNLKSDMFDGRSYLEFDVLPRVGEYFVFNSTSPWYKVLAVTHCPFNGADCVAEIVAIEANQSDVYKEVYSPYKNSKTVVKESV